MQMKSRKQFQMRAVTAGTAQVSCLMPDGQIWKYKVVILGANRFARGGKHEQLGWPPQTVFAEYGPAFTKKSGSLGYAKPVSLQGHLVSVNLITNTADLDDVLRIQREFIGGEIKAFRRWLQTQDHPQRSDWPQQVRQLEHGINAFGDHKLSYYQLLQQFISHFEGGSDRQKHRLSVRVDLANAIRDRYDKAINARLPVAILLINIKHVENYLYSDDRDIQFNTDKEDAAHRKAGDLQQVMFARVNQQKAQFERDGIPFYDPHWLATQLARNQPIWYPEQLDAFHLKF